MFYVNFDSFQRADVAAQALTISSARHLDFDLTKPFLFVGLGLLYRVSNSSINAFVRIGVI
jgi:hypothetical protein